MTTVTQITDNDWKSWRIYVLKELERLSCNLDALEKNYGVLKTRVDYIEWRSGILGVIGGTLGTVVTLLLIHSKLV